VVGVSVLMAFLHGLREELRLRLRGCLVQDVGRDIAGASLSQRRVWLLLRRRQKAVRMMQSDLFLRNRRLVQPQPRLRLPVQHLRTLCIRILGDRWLILVLIAFEIVFILFGTRIPLIPGVRPIGRKGPEGVLIREFHHAKLLLGH
jgi:hypothetical protein